jgi:hypothetical protein
MHSRQICEDHQYPPIDPPGPELPPGDDRGFDAGADSQLGATHFPGLQICADRGFVVGLAPWGDDADVDLAGA